jgi:hypothetical protein
MHSGKGVSERAHAWKGRGERGNEKDKVEGKRKKIDLKQH